MTEQNKQLLLKALCARLPYGVIVAYKSQESEGQVKLSYGNIGYIAELGRGWWVDCKPYLRPMSSMTDEEAKQLNSILPCSMSFSYTTGEELIICTDSEYDGDHYFGCFVNIEDWLNANHFDYRGLISMGLALEATKDMYKTE